MATGKNIRSALLLLAVALVFFFGIMVKTGVFGQ